MLMYLFLIGFEIGNWFLTQDCLVSLGVGTTLSIILAVAFCLVDSVCLLNKDEPNFGLLMMGWFFAIAINGLLIGFGIAQSYPGPISWAIGITTIIAWIGVRMFVIKKIQSRR